MRPDFFGVVRPILVKVTDLPQRFVKGQGHYTISPRLVNAIFKERFEGISYVAQMSSWTW